MTVTIVSIMIGICGGRVKHVVSTQRLCVVENLDSHAMSNILETGSAKKPESGLACHEDSECGFAYP